MKKKELMHLHALCLEIADFLESRGKKVKLTEYNNCDISNPYDFTSLKEEQKDAVNSILKDINGSCEGEINITEAQTR